MQQNKALIVLDNACGHCYAVGMQGLTTTSFNIPVELKARFERRCPSRGQRTRVMRQLILMFLRGEVQVKLPKQVKVVELPAQDV